MKFVKIEIMLIPVFIVSFLSFRLESQTPGPTLVIVTALLLAIFFPDFSFPYFAVFFLRIFPQFRFQIWDLKKKIKKTPGPALVIVTALRLLEVCQHQAALHYRQHYSQHHHYQKHLHFHYVWNALMDQINEFWNMGTVGTTSPIIKVDMQICNLLICTLFVTLGES